MKICHVITRMIVGGAQENTLFTIVGHIQKGHEVVLITGPSPGPEGELLKNSDFPEFEIIEVPDLVREMNVKKDYSAYNELKRIFTERKFDVVHTHSSKAGILGRAAAWKVNVPFVTHTVHGQAFHPYEKPWKNFFYISAERWAAKRCHKIYAVAQAMIDGLARTVGAEAAPSPPPSQRRELAAKAPPDAARDVSNRRAHDTSTTRPPRRCSRPARRPRRWTRGGTRCCTF